MELTQMIRQALMGAGLPLANFTMTGPDQLGAITVRSTTGDGEQISVAYMAACNALPREKYFVAHHRSTEDPNFTARYRSSGI